MRVVLADSDREFLADVQSFLWDCGHEAEVTSDALECISVLREFVPDVLVLDGDLFWGGSDGVLALESLLHSLACASPQLTVTHRHKAWWTGQVRRFAVGVLRQPTLYRPAQARPWLQRNASLD